MLNHAGEEALRMLHAWLGDHPDRDLQIERRPASLAVRPQAPGFEVTLYDQGDEAMIAAGRWHTHYDDPRDAAFGAIWLLTPYYRLVEELKGGVLVATWIERYETTGWEGFEPVYFLNPEHAGSWRLQGDERYVRRIRQQAAVPPPGDYAALCPGVVLGPDGRPPGSRLGVHAVPATNSGGLALFEAEA